MKWGEGFRVKDWNDLYLLTKIVLTIVIILLIISGILNFSFILNLFNLFFKVR